MTAYLQAFWRGETTGMADALGWVGLLLLGVAIALALVRVIGWTVDNWPGDLNDPNDFGADDVRVPKE